MEGSMRIEIEVEFMVHANEELRPANMLIERILQLEGVLILTPEDRLTDIKRMKEYIKL
jgi:bacterioferritin (cytochrome b1)